MDEKKVREAIYCMKSFVDNTVCEECNNYKICDHTMVADNARIAIEALEKQIPKKLKQNIFDEDSMTCICGSDIDKDEEFRFCPWCGQRLKKWEE